MLRSQIFRKMASKDPTSQMLKRELFGDIIQISLKSAAFSLSQSQAMKAELMRSVLDSSNHVLLSFTNKHSNQLSDEFYNHSYAKYKNVFVLIPALGFISSGLYNIFLPFFYESTEALQLNWISLITIIASSFGEFYLFYKNVGDINSFSLLPFWRRVQNRTRLALNVIANKISVDPIQDAIINENVLAMAGVCLPIFTSFLCYFTGYHWFDTVGSVLNGGLQVYLGYHLSIENIKILAGQSLDRQNTEKIVEIIEDIQLISSVEDFKSEYLGSEAIKVSATIKYDNKAISEKIMQEIKKEIDAYCRDSKDVEKIGKIVMKTTEVTLESTSEIIKNMENEIYQKFPQIVDVDLEISKANITKKY